MASFRFCLECNNMLYPKEDKIHQKLRYACRNCSYTQEAENACIFRNELVSNVRETAGVTQDIGLDPTLPRSDKQCPRCLDKECVFFQSQQQRAETTMILFYVCVECNYIFQSV